MTDIKNIKAGDHIDLRLKVREVGIHGDVWVDSPNNYLPEQYLRITAEKSDLIVNHIQAPPTKPKVGDKVTIDGMDRGSVLMIDEFSDSAWVKWMSAERPITMVFSKLKVIR